MIREGVLDGTRYTPEQIAHLLREAEVHLSQGRTVREMCRELGFAEQTYYRWRRTYGGLDVNHARRLKELERENGRLKRLGRARWWQGDQELLGTRLHLALVCRRLRRRPSL